MRAPWATVRATWAPTGLHGSHNLANASFAIVERSIHDSVAWGGSGGPKAGKGSEKTWVPLGQFESGGD